VKNNSLQGATALARAYLHAKRLVLDAGFGHEIVWQRSRPKEDLSESAFLREAAWVILSAGMRESVVRCKFPAISDCFLYWQSAAAINRCSENCYHSALRHFGHEKKIGAICTVAAIVEQKGFDIVLKEMKDDPFEALRQFPYIGPVTSLHLAKNLGIQIAKPDRHLSRLAEHCGYHDTQILCTDISQFTGDSIDVVDIVLWRYSLITAADYSSFAFMAGVVGSERRF
jgi:hypothetical protein